MAWRGFFPRVDVGRLLSRWLAWQSPLPWVNSLWPPNPRALGAAKGAQWSDSVGGVASVYLNVPPRSVCGNINANRSINHCHTEASTGPVQFSSVQSLSRVRLFATPWIAARQASLSITSSRTLLKLMPIKSVMPSSHLILCLPLLLLSTIPPSIRVFSNESALHIR